MKKNNPEILGTMELDSSSPLNARDRVSPYCLYPFFPFKLLSFLTMHVNMSGYSSPRRDSSHPPSRHGLTTPTRSRNSSRAPSRIGSRRGSLSSPAPAIDAVTVLTDSANFQDLPSVSTQAKRSCMELMGHVDGPAVQLDCEICTGRNTADSRCVRGMEREIH